MVWLKAGEALGNAIPGWVFADGRHFVNFLAFQMAIVSVFALAVRFVRPWVALAGVLLFETQPVFFGHAFINQKDIPFMGFFAATVVLGICFVDRFRRDRKRVSEEEREDPPRSSSWDILRQGWSGDRRRARAALGLAVGLAVLVPTGRLVANPQLHALIEQTIQDAYRGKSWAPVNDLFLRVAENAATVAPEAYVLRANRLTDLATAGATIVMVFVATAVVTRYWPGAHGRFWPTVGRELRQGTRGPIPWLVVPAAIVLGMGIAVRSMTLFAGALVVFTPCLGRAEIAVLLAAYLAIAGFSAYLLWPLWGRHFACPPAWTEAAIPNASDLFEGVVLLSDDILRVSAPIHGHPTHARPGAHPGRGGDDPAIQAGGADAGLSALPGPSFLLWRSSASGSDLQLPSSCSSYPHVYHIGLRWKGMQLVRRRRGWALCWRRRSSFRAGPSRLHPYGTAISMSWWEASEHIQEIRSAIGAPVRSVAANAHAASAGIAVSARLRAGALPGRPSGKDDSESALQPISSPGRLLNLATVDPGFFPDAPVLWTVERDGTPLAIVKLLGRAGPVE
jgi:hypothetical protein